MDEQQVDMERNGVELSIKKVRKYMDCSQTKVLGVRENH
jgi:hypothetical protein